MKGDFSTWRDERRQNFSGVLHQQGRVLLDSDWNAQTAITNDWQDTAALDIIGSGVAAVPADESESLLVSDAQLVGGVGGKVSLTVAPGRVWADGLLAQLFGSADVTRTATYLDPPIQTPPADAGAANTRDAVVLEVWREEINGFQLPNLLIEPALGGPDTTERVHTEMAFRLLRLTDADTCESIVDDLQDKPASPGLLTVTLDAPSLSSDPDCPLVEGGGYTGFEHNLYRIEIANVKTALAPHFKWSQFGGGLVGRGLFDSAKKLITINAGQQAILNSGLQTFYLEVLAFNPELGHWGVTYGANASLGGNDTIELPDPAANPNEIFFGDLPGNGDLFFRLWNAIEPIADFDDPVNALQDGILLKFDAAAPGKYRPGDYWTFPVRAGDIGNSTPLIDQQPPAGITYHRVPLAILKWGASPGNVIIEDCREIFQPLTRLATCCTYTVGQHGHGKFSSIQDAVNALPAEGGEVCVLPGTYVENVAIVKGRRHITIKGCGPRTRVVSAVPEPNTSAPPVFHISESQDIKILSLQIEADDTGLGVQIAGRSREELVKEETGDDRLPNLNITLENLVVRAAARCAVECEVGYNVTLRRCRIEMKDVPSVRPAVFLAGEDVLVEENFIVVADAESRVGEFEVINPLDAALAEPAEFALGGLQLGGLSERMRVINNVIARGNGQGITLGNIITVKTQTGEPVHTPDPDPGDCGPCGDGNTSVPPAGGGDTTRQVSAGDLYEILIERNRIFNMGLDGIGVAGFFDLDGADQFISVHRLEILCNDIRKCLGRGLDVPEAMEDLMGYGGISLADVDYLVIRDNFIVDNGPSFTEPVCGIFVLHGEGIEISRNHILNNGAKQLSPPPPPPPPAPAGTAQDSAGTSAFVKLLLQATATAQSVKLGRRGGINIAYAVAPVELFPFGDILLPGQNGMPAAKIHDNVVSVPVGQALSLIALGPVSVVGNQFTSRGTILRFDSPTLIAGTVMIINLGLPFEFYSQILTFAKVKSGQITINENQAGNDSFLLKPSSGLDDMTFGAFVADGNVLFSNNQCVLDLAETGFSFAFFSIVIISLDDVGFLDNQCEASMVDDFILSQAFLLGFSLRVCDNRFKEGLFNAALSGITLGLFNTTTDNQSTHCLFIWGAPQLTVNSQNTSIANLFGKRKICDQLLQSDSEG